MLCYWLVVRLKTHQDFMYFKFLKICFFLISIISLELFIKPFFLFLSTGQGAGGWADWKRHWPDQIPVHTRGCQHSDSVLLRGWHGQHWPHVPVLSGMVHLHLPWRHCTGRESRFFSDNFFFFLDSFSFQISWLNIQKLRLLFLLFWVTEFQRLMKV